MVALKHDFESTPLVMRNKVMVIKGVVVMDNSVFMYLIWKSYTDLVASMQPCYNESVRKDKQKARHVVSLMRLHICMPV